MVTLLSNRNFCQHHVLPEHIRLQVLKAMRSHVLPVQHSQCQNINKMNLDESAEANGNGARIFVRIVIGTEERWSPLKWVVALYLRMSGKMVKMYIRARLSLDKDTTISIIYGRWQWPESVSNCHDRDPEKRCMILQIQAWVAFRERTKEQPQVNGTNAHFSKTIVRCKFSLSLPVIFTWHFPLSNLIWFSKKKIWFVGIYLSKWA